MSISYGDDFAYAASRLNESVVVHSETNTPVYIQRVDDEGNWLGQNALGKRAVGRVENLDLTPVKLGYVNSTTYASYIQRRPERRYRQGFRQSSMHNLSDTPGVRILSPELASTIRGIYPTLEMCIDRVENGEATTQAFSREFAVSRKLQKGYTLLFKDKVVGWVDCNDNVQTFGLDNKYEYLSEMLTEIFDAER